MVAAAESMRPVETSSIEHARATAAWFASQLETLDNALALGDQSLADRIAALVFGCERLPRVRRAMAVELHSIAIAWPALEKRWERARKCCAFPEPRMVSAAMKTLAQPPHEAKETP